MWVEEASTVDIDHITRFFTNQQYDKESGLYYYNARYYDPHLGSFITPDPAMDGLNHYAYCGGNPVIYNDPTGLMKSKEERQEDREQRQQEREERREEYRNEQNETIAEYHNWLWSQPYKQEEYKENVANGLWGEVGKQLESMKSALSASSNNKGGVPDNWLAGGGEKAFCDAFKNAGNKNTPDFLTTLVESVYTKLLDVGIALGNESYKDQIAPMADQTGGSYYYAPTPLDMEAIYNDIA